MKEKNKIDPEIPMEIAGEKSVERKESEN